MKTQRLIIGLIVVLISLLPLVDLFHPGLPVTHDGQDHVARIANFYQSLSEGNPIPRWAGNLNWGYGHPVLMFLYPLPSYIASGMYALHPSFVDSVKLVFAVSYVASIALMYLWAQSAWGIWAGLVAAILYGFAPYRFVDMYVRGAIGEHVAFMFLPLILLGLEWESKKQYSPFALFLIAFSTGCLILAHNAVSLMFLPLVVLYALWLFVSNGKKDTLFLPRIAVAIGFGFLFSAFFWIPAFFEGKYTLRDIVTRGEFDARFVPWIQFFEPVWNYGGSDILPKSIGFSQWGAMAFLVYIVCVDKRSRRFGLGVLIAFIGSLVIMTGMASGLWKALTLLQKFQFPWRFLTVSVALSAIGASYAVSRTKIATPLIALILSVAAIFGTSGMWHAKAYITKPESFFTGIYAGTTDTGESSPIWSIRFMEHIPPARISTISGSLTVMKMSRTSTKHEYTVVADTESSVVEHTVYFPGWSVSVDGSTVPVEFQNPSYRGLMTFSVPKGTHEVTVSFSDTKLRRVSVWISILSFVLSGIVLGTMPIWRRKKTFAYRLR